MRIQRPLLLACMLVAFMLLNASAAVGQEGKVERKVVVSTNPILDMFTWWNGEVEVKIASHSTVGVAGSYISIGGDDDNEKEEFKSFAGFYRYYPQGDAFAGFFFGARFGIYYVDAWDEDEQERGTGNFYGFGIDIGYGWLLGESRRFNVSLGVGAVRLFGGDLEDVALTLPTIRLINVGVAF